MPNASELVSVSGTCPSGSLNRRLPPPSTTGKTSRSNRSSRPCRSSQLTRAELPLIPMFWPGCCLSSLIWAVMSPLINVEFCQSAEASVLDTTYFGVLFIWSAIPPDWPPKAAAKPW